MGKQMEKTGKLLWIVWGGSNFQRRQWSLPCQGEGGPICVVSGGGCGQYPDFPSAAANDDTVQAVGSIEDKTGVTHLSSRGSCYKHTV